MTNIRINDLPADAAPNAADVTAVDGSTTRKTTLTQLVNAGRPFASQAQAEAGTSPTTAMSPLTTAQAIAAIGGATFPPAAAGVPTGGTLNQVLGKTSGADYAMSWRNAGAGDLIAANNLSDVTNTATALANLGGQPIDADLTAIAALTTQPYGRSLLTLTNGTGIEVAPAIHAATGKAVPVDLDEFGLADSAAAFALKKLTWANLKEGIRGFMYTANKVTPADGDPVGILDSATSFSPKYSTWAQIKVFLKSYFDTTYPAYVATRAAVKAIDTTKSTAVLFDGSQWRFLAGDYSALVTADTQEGYVIKATAIAATAGAWVRSTTVHTPEHFQAVSDWTGSSGTSTNNATALQKMLDVAKLTSLPMVISDGPGYYCNATLSITNLDFVMSGAFGASRIVFGTSATDGLVISQDTYEHPTHILSLTITTLGQETGTGLKITYGTTDCTNNRNMPRCRLLDLDIRGEVMTSQGWLTGILLTDVHRPDIVRPSVTGRRDLAFTDYRSFNKMQYGIRVVGSVGAIPSDIRITQPRIDHAQEAVSASGEVEGLLVTEPVLIGVLAGVKVRYSSQRPWVRVNGGHINCFEFGVDAQNAPQSKFSDLLIYKFQTATLATVGIKLDGCSYSKIEDLTLINNASTSAGVNGEWDGIQIVSSDQVTIDEIMHDKPSRTVAISGTAGGCETRNLRTNGTFTGATVAIYLDTSSNVNSRIGGGRKVVSNASGAITVLSGNTTVCTSGALNVNKGERYLVHGMINTTKGVVAGDFLTILTKSGTATSVFNDNRASLLTRILQGASASVSQVVSGVITVTASGTLTVNLQGNSQGSNSDVLAGDGQLTIEML